MVLRVCKDVESLWINYALETAASSDQRIISLICTMRPRRLRTPERRSIFHKLLQHRPEGFSNLTHVQVDWPYAFEHLSLPSLTHLIIINQAEAHNGEGLCCQWVLIAVLLSKTLVVCGLVAKTFHDEKVVRSEYRNVKDSRFVIVTPTRKPEDDWTAESRGEKDFFALAEDLVRKKLACTYELWLKEGIKAEGTDFDEIHKEYSALALFSAGG